MRVHATGPCSEVQELRGNASSKTRQTADALLSCQKQLTSPEKEPRAVIDCTAAWILARKLRDRVLRGTPVELDEPNVIELAVIALEVVGPDCLGGLIRCICQIIES